MSEKKNIVVRAFEIAESGACTGWSDVADQLSKEGYSGVHSHFSSGVLKKQIRAKCREARISESDPA